MSDPLGLGFWMDITSLVRRLSTQQETERLDALWHSYRKAVRQNDTYEESDKLFEEIKEEIADKASFISMTNRHWKP